MFLDIINNIGVYAGKEVKMTLKKKKELAKELVEELDGKSGEDLKNSVDELLRDYSPEYIGNDLVLWGEIRNELMKSGVDCHMIQHMEQRAVRMREYKITIRRDIPGGYGHREEHISVWALSTMHAYERAAEVFEKTTAAEYNLNPKDWYIMRERSYCNG